MLAIQEAETHTSGEIRVHLSYAKVEEEGAITVAQKQFEKLNMHVTQDRNGILLYLNPKARKFAVFGDQGIHTKVGQEFWDELSVQIKKAIQEENMVYGIKVAVLNLGKALKEHFPHYSGQKNELKDDVTESD